MKLFPSRVREATGQQLVASGAAGAAGIDPVDGDTGYRAVGDRAGEIPTWTRNKARAYSVAAYRTNPMARAIIDTYVAFCVGDSGVNLNVTAPEVAPVAESFWRDPANNIAGRQELALRSHLLLGESCYEMLVGQMTGAVRYSVIDTARIERVELLGGNALWPSAVVLRDPHGGEMPPLDIVRLDEVTELRTGAVQFWASFKALETDTRGDPFLSPVLDWLASYDRVLSNLIDRTALARYLVWDVQIDGDQTKIDEFIAQRGGVHAPRSGTVEVHNQGVTWTAKTADTGSYEDTNTSRAVMTSVAAGAGLSKVWLAEPEDANRATSLTMAEPVRRRVGGVQNTWLGYQTELVRFAVDRAVSAGRIDPTVRVRGEGNVTHVMSAADTVRVVGPQIAAADAKVTAEVLHRLGLAIKEMRAAGVISAEAAKVAVKRGWEEFVGVPYTPELDADDTETDEIANAVDDADRDGQLRLAIG